MEFVKSIDDILWNMKILDNYLNDKHEPEYSFALDLIKKGTCFIAVKVGQSYRFYPSRFIGYVKNNMDIHNNNTEKDGRKTNPVISDILKTSVTCNPILETAYQEYCNRLGFIANEKGTYGVERKYWLFPKVIE